MFNRKKQSTDAQPNRRHASVRTRGVEPTPYSAQFRRNRTLTGSSSARISSTNELQADMSSPRALAHHLERHRRKLGFRLVGIIIGLLVLYLLVSQLVANVSISASENVQLPANTSAGYQKKIDAYFATHPLQRFFPSLDQAALTAYLQSEYPEIQSSSFALTGTFGQVSAQVMLRKPVVRWDVNGSREFVDENGIVFGYNAFETPNVQIIDNSGANRPGTGSSGLVTSHRFLGFVGTIVGDAKARGYTITQATIPALTTRQLEVTIDGVKPHFKLTVDLSAGEQVEDISRIIPYMKQKSLSADYVDVRVEGKAFYK